MNLDIAKSRYNEQSLQVPWPFVTHRGSTVPKIDVNIIKWNP